MILGGSAGRGNDFLGARPGERLLSIKELTQAEQLGRCRTWVQAMKAAMELDGVLWPQRQQSLEACLRWRAANPGWTPAMIYTGLAASRRIRVIEDGESEKKNNTTEGSRL